MPPLLEVENLKVQFKTDDGIVRAVDGVSFSIAPGETLGIVGESGSGKSVTSLAIMGLVPMPPGRITDGVIGYAGRDLRKLDDRAMAGLRGNRIAMVFQDPMTSLNPFLTIGRQLTEGMLRHRRQPNQREANRRAIELLDDVGITSPQARMKCYPHELSGGMRQRVMIAIALACDPDLLIADEPTTALDVTIQAQILELLGRLQEKHKTAIILITHDLGVVAGTCDRVAVMYAGRIIEEAPVDELFERPRHPYTHGLLGSIPRLDERTGAELTPIEGQPPDLSDPPAGCAFRPRCPRAMDVCEAGGGAFHEEGSHWWTCYLPEGYE